VSLDRPVAPDPYALLPEVGSFTLSSPDIRAGEPVDLDFAYGPDAPGGANRSPRLHWSGFPQDTGSFCVSCFDPDAPTPSGFWHWTVVDIPVEVTELGADAGNSNRNNLPDGAFHVATDFGTMGYDGPCPPPGDQVHRYFFVVHAVDVPNLGLESSTSATAVAFNLAFHTLARAILVPTFAF
jgi:Raf kinase inhibitor-like YbhB/YbcL family protein